MPNKYSIIIEYYPKLRNGREMKKEHDKISRLARNLSYDCEISFKNNLGHKKDKKTCRSIIKCNDLGEETFNFYDELRKKIPKSITKIELKCSL